MSGLDALYQELILDHSKRPRGKGLTDPTGPSARSHQQNPICGDDVTVQVQVSGDSSRVVAVTWDGAGCSISQSSASMLATLIDEDAGGDGIPRDRVTALIDGFREALRSRGTIPLDEETYADAAALSGVSKYSARVKCAMLAWVALEDALARA